MVAYRHVQHIIIDLLLLGNNSIHTVSIFPIHTSGLGTNLIASDSSNATPPPLLFLTIDIPHHHWGTVSSNHVSATPIKVVPALWNNWQTSAWQESKLRAFIRTTLDLAPRDSQRQTGWAEDVSICINTDAFSNKTIRFQFQLNKFGSTQTNTLYR